MFLFLQKETERTEENYQVMFTELTNINYFAILLMLILYFHNRINNKSDLSSSNRYFSYCILAALVSVGSFLFTWYLDGKSFSGSIALNWFFNVLYLSTILVHVVFCLLFIYYRLSETSVQMLSRSYVFRLYISLGIVVTLNLLTPLTHWIFYIDTNNYYHRGPLFWVNYLYLLIILIIIIAKTIIHRRHEIVFSHQKECQMIVLAMVFPLTAMWIQIFFYGYWVIWSAMALALLLLYINLQNQRITTDGLTGLNNRREMERFLTEKVNGGRNDPFAFIMVDIDHFKQINDSFGHKTGDEALCRLSSILRKTYGNSAQLLARIGGDEFAVIFSCGNMEEAEINRKNLEQCVLQSSEKEMIPYDFYISTGVCFCPKDCGMKPGEIYLTSDDSLYAEKAQHHAIRA